MKVNAYAKVNLTLHVLDRTYDGYHNISTLFQPVTLHDELTVEAMDDFGFELTCSDPSLEGKDNIVYKAFVELLRRFSPRTGVRVHIEKHIPMQAGLGGGSADAAAFLMAVNKELEMGLSFYELESVASVIGADVPALLLPFAAVGTGIGNVLEPVITDFSYPMLIVRPDFSCSTGALYQMLDGRPVPDEGRLRTAEAAEALRDRDLQALCGCLVNDFEEVIPQKVTVERIKAQLLAEGACGALLTGSGSCVYGIFADAAARDAAADKLGTEYEVYSCEARNEPDEYEY